MLAQAFVWSGQESSEHLEQALSAGPGGPHDAKVGLSRWSAVIAEAHAFSHVSSRSSLPPQHVPWGPYAWSKPGKLLGATSPAQRRYWSHVACGSALASPAFASSDGLVAASLSAVNVMPVPALPSEQATHARVHPTATAPIRNNRVWKRSGIMVPRRARHLRASVVALFDTAGCRFSLADKHLCASDKVEVSVYSFAPRADPLLNFPDEDA